MAEQFGIIAYEAKSYGPKGQLKEIYTRHIYTGGAVEGSATLCGRTITEGSARYKWTAKQEGLLGRPSSQVDCLRCINTGKLASIRHKIVQTQLGRVFMPIGSKAPQASQDAQQSPSSSEEPLDSLPALAPVSRVDYSQFDAAGGGWIPPSSEDLQATLERLLDGYGQEPPLRESVASLQRSGSGSRLGRFLSADDWQIIAWAVNAWAIVDDEAGSAAFIQKAGMRAASIWRD